MHHRVFHDFLDTVRGIMVGRLSPVEQVHEIGSAEVRAVFGSGSRKIAGCMVNECTLKKGCTVEVRIVQVLVWLSPQKITLSSPSHYTLGQVRPWPEA